MSNLNPDQFLPGTEHIRPAEPYEQTEAQFHNRPDVMVHGRFVREDRLTQPGLPNQLAAYSGRAGFHAGTARAAQERVATLGPANKGYAEDPRFFHGRVDPAKMKNTPDPGAWEDPKGPYPPPINDPGRIVDQGDDWQHHDHNKYYKNEHEDPGSVSSVHSVESVDRHSVQGVPNNFKTWRQSVAEAQESGAHIPSHVKAVYDATGGTAGPHHVINPAFYKETTEMRSGYGYDLPMVRGNKTGHWWVTPHADKKGMGYTL